MKTFICQICLMTVLHAAICPYRLVKKCWGFFLHMGHFLLRLCCLINILCLIWQPHIWEAWGKSTRRWIFHSYWIGSRQRAPAKRPEITLAWCLITSLPPTSPKAWGRSLWSVWIYVITLRLWKPVFSGVMAIKFGPLWRSENEIKRC